MYPTTKKAEETEMNTIKNIPRNNEYNTNLIKKPHPPQKQNTHTDPQHQKNKMGHLYILQQRGTKNY
jgi:hypothetical protein